MGRHLFAALILIRKLLGRNNALHWALNVGSTSRIAFMNKVVYGKMASGGVRVSLVLHGDIDDGLRREPTLTFRLMDYKYLSFTTYMEC